MKQRVKAEDRIGQVFGRLTVVSLAGKKQSRSNRSEVQVCLWFYIRTLTPEH